jgi:UDP-N-acetylglucosamine 2-epimerase (non-hydrolysing)
MHSLKVMTVVGTRPELIRLSRVIAALDAHTLHVLVHTGQNYDCELSEVFFRDLGIRKPDYFLAAAGDNATVTIGSLLLKIDPVLTSEKPDAMLVLGDTNSCLAVIAAKRHKIPVFHMEAGNRCFDERVPEEINRRIIDHISDINLPYTEHARRYLLAEGIRPETVIKTGSPMREVLGYYEGGITASTVLKRLKLVPRDYFVVSAHREENIDNPANLTSLLASLEALSKRFKKRVIVSTHPRTRKKLATVGKAKLPPKVEFLKPLGFFDYVSLQANAYCTLSDSGTLTEESAILAFPAVMIRQAHERPEGMDQGTLIMSGLKPPQVIEAVAISVAQYAGNPQPFSPPPDYDAVNVSQKVLRIILSYTDYVNRTVWRK